MKLLAFGIAISTIAAGAAFAEVEYLNGDVTSVSDGDTMVVLVDGEKFKVRLYGVDAPEKNQQSGPEAATFTSDLVKGKAVTVMVHDRDRYGRVVGEVFIEGRSVNRLLAQQGWAWWYETYADEDRDLQRLVSKAKTDRKGLWTESSPIPPWDFRRMGQSTPAFAAMSALDKEALDLMAVPGAESRRTRNSDAAGLRAEIARTHRPNRVLSYGEAREEVFLSLDNNGGKVELFYSGSLLDVNGQMPNHQVANIEHIWPQSRFGRARQVKSDLHHLAPTWNKVNGARGNNPFAEIDDQSTKRWWAANTPEQNIPRSTVRDRYSEDNGSEWEPREVVKGDVARAMMYVYVIYGPNGIDQGWFKAQCMTLLNWHNTDPPSQAELARMEKIAAIQGNVNPFILNPDLALSAIDCAE